MAETPAFNFSFDPSASSFNQTQHAYVAANSNGSYAYIATGALVFDNATEAQPPRILLIQRAANDSMPNRWEIPGGGCDDDDQSILHAVARELWEEAGLKAARVGGLVGEPHAFSSRTGKKICRFNFIVQVERDEERGLAVRLDPAEHQAFVWASEEDIRSKKVKDLDLVLTTKHAEETILAGFDGLKQQAMEKGFMR